MPDDWRICSIEIEPDSEAIGRHFQQSGYPAERLRLEEKKYETKDEVLAALLPHLPPGKRTLALSGHGRYHHFDYGLCRIADAISDEFCYIIIDRHFDWGRNPQAFDCGKFVSHIHRDTHVQQMKRNVIFLGADEKDDEPPLPGQAISLEQYRDSPKSLEYLLRQAAGDAYVSIDLDVTHPSVVRTAYDRGGMMANELSAILRRIRRVKNIKGAHILGFTETNWPCSAYARCIDTKEIAANQYLMGKCGIYIPPSFEQSMKVYKEVAAIIMEE